MTASLHIPWGDQSLQLIFDPSSDESYATQGAADMLDEIDIEIDEDGLYFMNLSLRFFSANEEIEIEQDLFIEENSENDYFVVLGKDFLSSDQVHSLDEEYLVLTNGYNLMTFKTDENLHH